MTDDLDSIQRRLEAARDALLRLSYVDMIFPKDHNRYDDVKSAAEYGRASLDLIDTLERGLAEETAIVDRIWCLLGSPTYDELKGRSIYDMIQELQARAYAAEQERDAMRKALEPFANYAENTGLVRDDFEITSSMMPKRQLTMGDCRAAYHALNKTKELGG